MRIAVDFDGTLFSDKQDGLCVGEPNLPLIAWLKDRQVNGDSITLWTCRENEWLEEAVNACKEYELNFDAINDNLPESIAKRGINSRKIVADIYIDDRAREVRWF